MIDQPLQMESKGFKKALKRVGQNKKALWERWRSLFQWIPIQDWEQFFDLMTGIVDPTLPPSRASDANR